MEKQLEYPSKLRFTSQYKKYRIVLVPPTTMEVGGMLVRKQGNMLSFMDNECVCTDPDTIKLALESGYYGKEFIAPEWEKMKYDSKNKTTGGAHVAKKLTLKR